MPKEPDAIVSVELDFELFLIRVERDPQIYIYWNFIRVERDPPITHKLLLLGLKQTHKCIV